VFYRSSIIALTSSFSPFRIFLLRLQKNLVVKSGGVAGFHVAALTTQGTQESRKPRAAQLPYTAQAVPYKSTQGQNSPEALATEIGAILVEPCHRCSCTLSYQSEPYRLCHWRLPRPTTFGRCSDDFSICPRLRHAPLLIVDVFSGRRLRLYCSGTSFELRCFPLSLHLP
jgi:hypothetical protein